MRASEDSVSLHWSAPAAATGRRIAALAGIVTAVLWLTAPAALAEEKPESSAATERRPIRGDAALRIGALTLDPEVRLDTDWRRIEPAPQHSTPGGLALSGRRVGVEGRLGRRLDFEVSAELTSSTLWRDAKVEYSLPGSTSVRAGQFKAPFSLDGTLKAAELDFVSRSRLAESFTIGRDQGVAVESRLLRKRVSVELGLFRRDGNRIDRRDEGIEAARTTTLRVTASPMARSHGPLEELHVGVSAAASRLDEGLSSLTLRSTAGKALTAPMYWAKGTRVRVGTDLRWRVGPASVSAEYLAIADERREQSNRNDDLAPLRGSAWYVHGTWLLTGEKKTKTIRPAAALNHGGLGALEAVGRVEHASLGTAGLAPEFAASPRAHQPAGSDLRAVTAGLNWYPAGQVRVQYNIVHERSTGATSPSMSGDSSMLTNVVRFQLFL